MIYDSSQDITSSSLQVYLIIATVLQCWFRIRPSLKLPQYLSSQCIHIFINIVHIIGLTDVGDLDLFKDENNFHNWAL